MDADQIKKIISQIFGEIAPEVEFNKVDTTRPLRDQVEIDSFDFYRIIVQISKETGVNVPDSKLAEFSNLNELIQFVSEKSSPRPLLSPGP